jgi:hypothetical protein
MSSPLPTVVAWTVAVRPGTQDPVVRAAELSD